VSYSLDVPLLRPVRVDELFAATQAALAELTCLAETIEIRWKYPPNPKLRAALTDILSEGVSFYVTLAGVVDGSLVHMGVLDSKWMPDDPPLVYFSVHSFPPANVLALAMAFATARICGSTIRDGASHWFAEETNKPEDAVSQFQLAETPANLNAALNQINERMYFRQLAVCFPRKQR
jgi:hypothetical protein